MIFKLWKVTPLIPYVIIDIKNSMSCSSNISISFDSYCYSNAHNIIPILSKIQIKVLKYTQNISKDAFKVNQKYNDHSRGKMIWSIFLPEDRKVRNKKTCKWVREIRGCIKLKSYIQWNISTFFNFCIWTFTNQLQIPKPQAYIYAANLQSVSKWDDWKRT